MTELTKEEKLDLIKQLISHKRDIDVFHKKFDELFGVQNGFMGSSEGHGKVFDRIFCDYIRLVANRIEESVDGIEWFIYENDCGKRSLEAGFGDQMMEIKDAESYINFIDKYGEY